MLVALWLLIDFVSDHVVVEKYVGQLLLEEISIRGLHQFTP